MATAHAPFAMPAPPEHAYLSRVSGNAAQPTEARWDVICDEHGVVARNEAYGRARLLAGQHDGTEHREDDER